METLKVSRSAFLTSDKEQESYRLYSRLRFLCLLKV